MLANNYRARFAGWQGLEMPTFKLGIKQGYHLFTIWVDLEKRDHILWALQDQSVGVAVNYRACHLCTLFRRQYGYQEGDFPNAERIGSRTISLPLYAFLLDEEAGYVAKTVKKVLHSLG
jgi:dTDP-4-amino-4,6-dideoxygalactose transaminase